GILQPDAAGAAEVDLVETACDGVKAGGIDNDVELEFLLAGLDTPRRDALDRRRLDVDQLDIVLVVDLEIKGLERQAACAKTVIPGDQLLGHLLILDALADFSRDEVADGCIGLAVDQYVAKVALPDAETAFAVKLFVVRLALFIRNLECAAWVGRMDEA